MWVCNCWHLSSCGRLRAMTPQWFLILKPFSWVLLFLDIHTWLDSWRGLVTHVRKVIHRLSGGAMLDGIGDIGGGLRTRVVRSALQSINLTLEWHQLIFILARFLIYDQINKHVWWQCSGGWDGTRCCGDGRGCGWRFSSRLSPILRMHKCLPDKETTKGISPLQGSESSMLMCSGIKY